jgi:uncharacterized membrane protein YidH (DUF202 family)
MTPRPADPWPQVPVLLALPLVVLALVGWLEVQPFTGLLRAATSDADGSPTLLGMVLMFGSLAAFLAATLLSLAEVIRAWRAGRGWRARPYHLGLAVVLVLAVCGVVGGIVVDQAPCWQGVPNCD